MLRSQRNQTLFTRVVLLCLLLSGQILAESGGLVLYAPDAVGHGDAGFKGVDQSVDGAALKLRAQGDRSAEVVITPADGAWDLSAFAGLEFHVRNTSPTAVTVRVRAECEAARDAMDSCRTATVLLPGESKDLTLRLMRRPEDPGYDVFRPFMMYFKNLNVRDNTVDPVAIARIVVWVDHPTAGQTLELGEVRAVGSGESTAPAFFPFVDQYGQYIHTDWPGKVYSDEEFAERRREEEQERADWPGPDEWDKYGGWAKGPRLKATGYFYAAKHEGKWWLVDPDGYLFWSYGPTGVGFGGDVTPITDREHWFNNLPSRDSEWGRYYKNGHGATYRYYADNDMGWVGYDFAAANLRRKYGDGYEKVVPGVSHERLRSWGFNTIANWSAPQIYLQHRTPYTVPIHYDSSLIHYRMPDIYHPDWEPAVRASMERQRDTTAGDPWNIGYFVDNERWWGWRPRAAAIGEVTLTNPADCHAKLKFVELLKQKYDTIEKLNAAWGTSHDSWDALLASTDKPDMDDKLIVEDCGDFGMMFAERYFSTVRDIVKSVAPDNMYLGVRFHGHIDKAVVELAGRYSDVISYNVYDNPPDGRVNQYNDLDLPIMSTEWGVLSDQAMTPFRGDALTVDPDERTRNLVRYAERAIRHPNMVGAHFFQYRDQPISGRPDGEGTLRGFVNITDTPNFNLIEANRRITYDLYRTRYGAK